jgi:hypothetical protein
LLLRTATMLFGLIFLTLGLVVIDLITPSDYLDQVGSDALSCAMVCSAIMLSLALIFIYS